MRGLKLGYEKKNRLRKQIIEMILFINHPQPKLHNFYSWLRSLQILVFFSIMLLLMLLIFAFFRSVSVFLSIFVGVCFAILIYHFTVHSTEVLCSWSIFPSLSWVHLGQKFNLLVGLYPVSCRTHAELCCKYNKIDAMT